MNELLSPLYKKFFNNNETLCFVLNSYGIFVEANICTCNVLNINIDNLNKINIENISVLVNSKKVLNNLEKTTINRSIIFEFAVKGENNQKTPYEIYAKKIQVNNEQYIICNAHTIINSKEVENKILSAVIETEEKERSRFAKDLHDGLGPLLSTIKLYVHELSSSDSSENEKKEYIKYIMELLDEAVTNTREISNNLTPQIISTYGLVKSIDSFKNKINATNKLDICFTNKNVPENLSKTIKLTLFRIVTELINNTINHASANSVSINLYADNSKLHLDYKDDGKGFNINEALKKGTSGIGLINIINRIKSMSGSFNFNEKLTKGVEMKFSIDINE